MKPFLLLYAIASAPSYIPFIFMIVIIFSSHIRMYQVLGLVETDQHSIYLIIKKIRNNNTRMLDTKTNLT